LDKLKAIPGVVSYSKLIEERVVLNYDNKNEIVTLKGVDSNYPKATIDSILSYGSWMEGQSNQIVSGWGVSARLSFSVFDFGTPIKLYVPKPGKGQITSIKGAYNVIPVYNSGVFQINEDLDNSVVYCNIDTARQLLDYEQNEITALELLTSGDTQAISEELKTLFNDTIEIKTRVQLNDALVQNAKHRKPDCLFGFYTNSNHSAF
jgi:lipoprotein-releasing system permease protein